MADISFENVSFYREAKCIYNDISFQIPSKKITTILGPSGAGKTTILQLIAGLIKPTTGQICVDEHRVRPNSSEKSLEEMRKKLGFLFQSGALFNQMSVYDNIAFPIRKNTLLDENIIHTIVLLKLEAVGLAYTIDMMPSELSGGMARRVALARSIALDPDIMMYDEPFTGQDPTSFKKLLKLISTLNYTLGITSILVSHNIEESLSLSDHIIIVGDKSLIVSDTPENIKNSNDPKVQCFLNGTSDHHATDMDNSFFVQKILGV